MYVKNFVICDRQQQYAKNLLQMLSQGQGAQFQMYLFHSMEELKKFAQQKKINLLLIGEEFPHRQREKIPARERFVLVRGAHSDLGEGEVGVYRYQSAEDIWTQILEETAKKPEASARPLKRRHGELIGVYSPIHRIGKTRFALDLGKKLAEKEPVLYLNLEEYAGSAYYFQERAKQNLGDLLYYMRQEKANLGIRISMIAAQEGRLDYIPPIPYMQDMQAVRAEEWLNLFRQILAQCIYERVILDLGDSVNGLFQILDACSTVYTPYIEGRAAEAKLAEYTENLRKMGLERVLEKTVQKKMRQPGLGKTPGARGLKQEA